MLGPAVMLAWLAMPHHDALTPEAHRFAGVFLLTVIWWVTEPIPIAATGLLSVALAAMVGGVPASWPTEKIARNAFAPFASPSVFFLIGSLFIGCAMSRHGLDRRVAIGILATRWAGRSPSTILLGVGLATMLISMWVSNVAATAMIYPVTLGIIDVLGQTSADPHFRHSKYASSLLLMTGYASTIGGVSTPIGTSTNIVARGYFSQDEFFGKSVDFAQWCLVGMPLMIIIMGLFFVWLRFYAPLAGFDLTQLRAYLQHEHAKIGPWNQGEKNALTVFLIIVSLWVAPSIVGLLGWQTEREWLERHFPEELVSMLAPVLLFLLPVDWKRRKFTLNADDFRQIDWGTMLLFGAGLSLGNLMVETKLAQSLGDLAFAAIGSNDVWIVTAVSIAAAVIFSEFSSNSATASTLIPIVFALCKEAGVDAVPPLLGVTFAASFGSSLPVSTPPNAIVYGSGLLPVRRMIVAGTMLDMIAALAVLGVLYLAFSLGWSPFAV